MKNAFCSSGGMMPGPGKVRLKMGVIKKITNLVIEKGDKIR